MTPAVTTRIRPRADLSPAIQRLQGALRATPRRRVSDALELRPILQEVSGFAIDNDVFQVAKALYKGLNTPVSLQCLSHLQNRDYTSLANMDIDHHQYADPYAFYLDYCAVSFLRKFSGFPQPVVEDKRETAAIASWFQSEEACRATNERFGSLMEGTTVPSPLVLQVLEEARRLIKSTIGQKPPPFADWPLRFGPGVASNAKGEFATIADKLSAYPECTFDAVPLVAGLREQSPVWFNLLETLHPGCIYSKRSVTDDFGNEVVVSGKVAPRCIRGNRFTTVPKNAKTHRGIGIEPGNNVVLQLALGSVLTDRLTALGWCKDLQTEVNKTMAREASITGRYATIDLKAASDTISYELVKYLLPDRWFNTLAMLRSPETFISGQWVELEKFSSMGNGYTFELETLIFYAITRAFADVVGLNTEVHVFGDDIIVRGEALLLGFTEILSFCGFTINSEKSFYSTGFNESCGGDFLRGIDVRPYFLKEIPQNAFEWFGLVNGIRKMGSKHNFSGDCDSRFRGAWLCAFQHIPTPLRKMQGPPAEHDCWVHTLDERHWSVRYRDGILSCRGLRVVPVTRPIERYCDLTARCTALLTRVGDGLSLKGRIRRLGVGYLSIS